MKREECLEEARKCVCGAREEVYGSPRDAMGQIAAYWSAYLTGVTGTAVVLGPKDAVLMMALLKIARAQAGVKPDNWVDLAGYAAIGAEIESAQHREEYSK